MAFQKLFGRTLIAVPGIILFLGILFYAPPVWSVFLFCALAVFAGWEAVQLCCSSGVNLLTRILVSFTAGAATLLIAVDHPLALPALLLPGALVALCVMITMGPAHSRRRIAGTSALLGFYTMGFGILGWLFINSGVWIVFAILALCWLGDSIAYFAGSAFGRHKMMPRVSPNKSWEGFAGGIIGAVAGCVIVGSFGGFELFPLVVTGVAGGLAGVLGDLFESSLKRDAGVKDSGTILLGHGGILDRFDSAVAAAPAALVVLTLFGVTG